MGCLLAFGQHQPNGQGQGAKVCLGDVPDDERFDPVVFMPQDVSNSGDLVPWNVRKTRFRLAIDATAGFRDNLEAPLNSALHRPTACERLEISASQGLVDPIYRLGDVLQAQLTIAHGLKYPNGGLFDRCARPRVKAATTHDVCAGVKQLTDPLLKRDQFDEAEPRIFEVEKKVDVALRTGFIARRRSEEK